MRLTLSVVAEPVVTRRALASAMPGVRRASVRQATDIVTPIYHEWKAVLKQAGVSWQSFQAAASDNWPAWSGWVDGTIQWRQALDEFVGKLNLRPPASVFSLV